MSRLAFVLFVAALSSLARTTTSAIVATVTDSSGAVVPGVNISVRNIDTGIRSSTTTDGVGNYTVGQLPPGNYEISGEITGFKKFVRPNVTLELTRQLRIDIQLETGSASETVNVEAETPLVETETGQLSSTISTRE